MSVVALPGAPGMDEATAQRLQAALEARGPDYVPRTHHHADGRPRYTNRLVLETSPYLLQHAHNPVDWHPWGDEAFAEARARGVPVFLSIGYSTCHWCHVMEAESFEDEEIAAVLNARYVPIKVDREERPDIDAIYMSAVQALTGSGGWPMSVWLTPEREPFFGGTYFPPRDGARGASHGFLTLLTSLSDTYQNEPGRVRSATAGLVQAVREEMEGSRTPGPVPLPGPLLASLVQALSRAFDEVHGGLRRAPKFPSNLPIRVLLRYHRRTGDAASLRMATVTLERMAAGGIYDHLAGGFHRYSTDVRWLVPHFEKMLYDNALLAAAYLEAHQVTGRADFARVARETLDYVLREMTSPEGAFYSATDADSEGVEGRFFVWSEAEIRAALGADAERFTRYYGVTAEGNFEGANILNVASPSEEEWAALAAARRRLYELRARRVPPLRDDKILASWNGLMISALAFGGRVLAEPRYVEAARRAASFLLDNMRDEDGRLRRSFKDGQARHRGYLHDQAFVAAGLLELFEATFDPRWLREALRLSEALEERFTDTASGGWFMTPDDHEQLLAREKPAYDGAEPSGTSVAIANALRLATFTEDERWRDIADRALAGLGEVLADRPLALTEALVALDYASDVARQIAIVWPEDAGVADAEPLVAVLRRTFVPTRAIAGAAAGEGLASLSALVPFLADKVPIGGRPTAYACAEGRCELPTTDPEVLARQLAAARPYGPSWG